MTCDASCQATRSRKLLQAADPPTSEGAFALRAARRVSTCVIRVRVLRARARTSEQNTVVSAPLAHDPRAAAGPCTVDGPHEPGAGRHLHELPPQGPSVSGDHANHTMHDAGFVGLKRPAGACEIENVT